MRFAAFVLFALFAAGSGAAESLSSAFIAEHGAARQSRDGPQGGAVEDVSGEWAGNLTLLPVDRHGREER